jgi:large subunit ribosomal protein L23
MSDRSQLYNLLIRPIVTEKSMAQAQLGQYVFEVQQGSNKVELTKAFELAFPGRKVTAVRTVKIPQTTRRVGRKVGVVNQRQKAIFTIVGEPLELITGV